MGNRRNVRQTFFCLLVIFVDFPKACVMLKRYGTRVPFDIFLICALCNSAFSAFVSVALDKVALVPTINCCRPPLCVARLRATAIWTNAAVARCPIVRAISLKPSVCNVAPHNRFATKGSSVLRGASDRCDFLFCSVPNATARAPRVRRRPCALVRLATTTIPARPTTCAARPGCATVANSRANVSRTPIAPPAIPGSVCASCALCLIVLQCCRQVRWRLLQCRAGIAIRCVQTGA